MVGTEGRCTVWANLHGYLVKAPPELVRRATTEESLAEAKVEILRSTRTRPKGNEGQINFKDIEVEMGDTRDKDPKAEPKGNEADNKTKKAEPSGDEAEPSPKRSKIDGAGTELSEKLLRARSRAESLEGGARSPSFLDTAETTNGRNCYLQEET